MKLAIVVLAAALASAEVVYENGEFKCLGDSAGKNFCAGTSLETNIIIRCNGEKGQPGNCNNNLAGVPPIGVKTFAPCYQSSDDAGDAACSYNGVAYPDYGEPYPIPGYSPAPPPYDTSSSTSSVYVPPTYVPPTYVPPTYVPPTYVPPTEYPPEPTTTYYPPPNNSTYYPPEPTYYPPTTLTTVTGTTTVTTCSSSTTYAPPPPPPTYSPPPPANTTVPTTSLPVPTYVPSSASNIVARDGLLLVAIAVVGFIFL